jgi:hypothetical protein
MELWLIVLVLGVLSLLVGLAWPSRPTSEVRADKRLMKGLKRQITQLLARNESRRGQALVVNPPQTRHPALFNAYPDTQSRPRTMAGHFVDSFKRRTHLKIDGKTAQAALPTLRTLTEQAKLATEYQASLDALNLAEHEREVKQAELEQRKLELATQRKQHQRLEQKRLQKEQLCLQLEISTLQGQIQEQERPPEPKLSAAQQKLLKKAEIEGQLQQLRADEVRALEGAANDLEKRRLQNIYAAKREQLMQQMEKHI